MAEPLPDYIARNQAVWTKANKRFTAELAREAWAQDDVTWGT